MGKTTTEAAFDRVGAFLALAILLVACQQPISAPRLDRQVAATTNMAISNATGKDWDDYVGYFLDQYFKAHPDFAVVQGKHEFDGSLPDWSENGLKTENARLHAERNKAAAFQDARLDERQRFERDYLIAQIDKDLFWRETADQPHTNPIFYSDSIDPDVYISREYAPLETRILSYTAYARNVPNALRQIKANLKMPMARTLLKIGRQTIGSLAGFYEKDVPTLFAAVKNEQSQNEFKKANDEAIKAVKAFDAWLGEQEKTANENFALGTDKFQQMLKATEGVDVDLATLEAIGRQDLERNSNALKEECHRFAPSLTVMQCMAKVSANKAEGTNVVDAATKQLGDLRKFVQEKDVLTIPGTEEAQVRQAPSYKAWNFAYINIPGPYETGLPSIYYVSPPNPSWSK